MAMPHLIDMVTCMYLHHINIIILYSFQTLVVNEGRLKSDCKIKSRESWYGRVVGRRENWWVMRAGWVGRSEYWIESREGWRGKGKAGQDGGKAVGDGEKLKGKETITV